MIYSPLRRGYGPAGPPEKPRQAYACLKCRRAAPAALPFPARHGVRHFFLLCRFCCSDFRRRGHLRLPAARRHPVVRPDSDRQLLAHPPVSAEPAGAVSGCRYGPMSEKNRGLQRPFRSRRPCRAGNGAPALLTVCKATAPDGAVNPSAATPAACFPLWTFRGLE
ncbi:hypothetical protein ACP0HM_35690 [Escherichia coli]